MRAIPIELTARIESGAARLCHAWVMRRTDGVKLGFTDHDRDLIVENVTCRAASGWTAGAADSAVGLSAGSAAVAGGLDDAAITDADVEAGLYDGASVSLWRVDWDRPDLRVRLWTATLARIRREGAGFSAELEGPLAKLERVVGGGVSEVAFTATGLHERPWSPAHLRVAARTDGGFDLGWIARARIDGDRWDGEAAGFGSLRFRVRVLDGATERRAFELEGNTATFSATDLAVDFPGGLDGDSQVAVAQWGDGYGWGMEAFAALTP